MKCSRKQSGFTLLELAIVLIISGLLLAAAVVIAMPILRQAQMTQTNAKLANIARAIDFYATQNYRVPCPADPNIADANPGYEMGYNPANMPTYTAGCGGDEKWVGIVPYKTLNIPVDWIKDAWGHYITYAVSPDFTRDPTNNAITVHAVCRTADWYTAGVIYERNAYNSQTKQFMTVKDPTTGNLAAATLMPKNARKARFCCPGLLTSSFDNDLTIDDGNSNSQIVVTRDTAPAYAPPAACTADIDCSLYETADQPYAREINPASTDQIAVNTIIVNVQVPLNQRPMATVYVLLSHGINGHGAYIGNGFQVSTNGATPHELVNASGGRTYYDVANIDRLGTGAAGEMKFDDIMLWRTQDGIFAEQGKSCALP